MTSRRGRDHETSRACRERSGRVSEQSSCEHTCIGHQARKKTCSLKIKSRLLKELMAALLIDEVKGLGVPHRRALLSSTALQPQKLEAAYTFEIV